MTFFAARAAFAVAALRRSPSAAAGAACCAHLMQLLFLLAFFQVPIMNTECAHGTTTAPAAFFECIFLNFNKYVRQICSRFICVMRCVRWFVFET